MPKKIVIIFSLLSFYYLLFSLSSAPAREPSPLNILLITIDTIRSDHIGCYGYKNIKTPHIDYLAKNGLLFEKAFSPIPITLPSHVSILAGTYPTFHGIRNNGTYAVSESTVTLAELLKEKGYITAAFVSSYVLDKRFGLDQGFDVYNDDLSYGKEQRIWDKERRAEAVTKAALQWLKEIGQRKFFLWIHYFDPHELYRPPPPFSTEYADNPYDGEIAYTDHWLGTLLQTLHQLDLTEKTLIVLTGDHGEGLGDHQEKTHGIFIYDTTLQVPLIFTYPKLFPKSKRIKPLVRLIDIAPTIMDIIGLKPYKDMQGVSLLPLMFDKVTTLELCLYCESLYPQFSHNWSPLKGLRTKQWKYIEAPIKELYKLDKDLQEKINILDQEEGQAKEWSLKLSRLQNSITSSLAKKDTQRISLDRKTEQKLHSLGYIFTSTKKHGTEQYPDPKKMIGILGYFDKGMEYFGKGQYQKAKDQFLKVVMQNPSDVYAHIILGHTYESIGDHKKSVEAFEKALGLGCQDLRIFIKLGTTYMKHNQYQEAVNTFHKALAVNPRCKEAYINLALYYLQKEELDQAVIHLQKTLEIDPHDVTAHNNMAIIYQRKKRYNQAILACQAALNADPNNYLALFNLGATLLYTQRYPEASKALEKALKIKPDFVRIHYFAGLASFQENRADKAIAHFSQAIRLDPNWAEPHFNLGFIYHRKQNFPQAIKEYQAALRLNPDLIQAQKMLQQINY